MRTSTPEAYAGCIAELQTALDSCRKAMDAVERCERIAAPEHETEADAFRLLKSHLKGAILLLTVIEMSGRDQMNVRSHEAALRHAVKETLN
jgi:hypothetical protein